MQALVTLPGYILVGVLAFLLVAGLGSYIGMNTVSSEEGGGCAWLPTVLLVALIVGAGVAVAVASSQGKP